MYKYRNRFSKFIRNQLYNYNNLLNYLPSSYVEVKAIAGGRSASGKIQMDYSNQVIFHGVLNFTTSYDYYIGIQMHSYNQLAYYYLFCLPIVTIYGVSSKLLTTTIGCV